MIENYQIIIKPENVCTPAPGWGYETFSHGIAHNSSNKPLAVLKRM